MADGLVDDLEAALDADSGPALHRSAAPPALLVRSTLPELLGLALLDWLVMGLCWTAMALLPAWTWPLWILLVAGRLHALGVVAHDLCHVSLPRRSPVVAVLEVLCAYPLATTIPAMRYHHLRHHRDSGLPSDPYFKEGVDERPLLYALNVARGVLLVPFWTVRPWVALLARAWPAARTTYGRVWLQDRSGQDLTDSREVLRCARADLGQLVAQLGVLALIVLAPWPMLLGYVLPVTIAGLLAAWRLLQEHVYRRNEDRSLETILATTRDHHLGWLGILVLAPHNIGYHVVHHIHPQVGLAHLPPLRDWYRRTFPDRYP